MEFEEYYGEEYYEKMMKTVECLVTLTDKLKVENINADDLQPIVYYCHRIKRPESMQKKLIARGLPCTLDAAIHNVYDGVGFRIVCAFESDVHLIVDKLENCGLFKIDQKKDYISFPKPNGYRSIHLCIRNKDNGVLAEIQVRTIAMDCWATLEHQLKYKKNILNESLMKLELKRCADEIASVDLTMQTIREILKEMV